jgi:hypothetical protein
MEEDKEEEGDDDNMIFYGFAEYGAFDDTAIGEAEEEGVAEEEVEPTNDLGQAIRDAQRECESEKEKIKFKRMLEDHKKLLYSTVEDVQKKSWVPHWNCCNGRQNWCIQQGIWAVSSYPKEDVPDGKRIACHYVRSKIGRLPSGIRNP